MYASLWDRFSEDPGGFLVLGLAIAVVFLLLERVLRILFRRRELEEGTYKHRVANELPRTITKGDSATALKMEYDVDESETIRS